MNKNIDREDLIEAIAHFDAWFDYQDTLKRVREQLATYTDDELDQEYQKIFPD